MYFAIIQTPFDSLVPTLPSAPTPQQFVQLIPPILRISAGWSWLAYALRDPFPALPPVAHLVSVWVEIIGAEATRVYGVGQVGKVLDAIKREGLDGGKIKGDSEAARQRLGLLLDGWRDRLRPHPSRSWT